MTHEALSFLTKLRLHYGNPAKAVLPGTANQEPANELAMLGFVNRETVVSADGEDVRWAYQINDAGYQFLRDQETAKALA